MRTLTLVFFILIFIPLNSCDDGDVIDFELDFEKTFLVCEGGNDLVFYKIKETPSESLSIKVSNLSIEDIFNLDDDNTFNRSFSISSTNPFNYRTYSNTTLPDDLFCNIIPNSDVNITQDIKSTSGTANLRTVLTEDDNDGIPANLEDRNGNGNLNDDDTDNDGIPDYIDADDDGDNILTKNENPDPNGDDDLNDALDTDNDGIPNYLDSDDDGDGINTRDEENDSQDQNPANDITISESGPDYLNENIANSETPKATAYREHTISQTYVVTLSISNFDLELISQDILDFGVLKNTETTNSRKVTPEFP